MAQSDNPDNKDDKKEEQGTPPSLDQMHEATIRDLEEEDKGDSSDDKEEVDDKDESDVDKGKADKKDDDSGDDAGDKGDSDNDDSGVGDDEPVVRAEEAPELDDDTTKPGKDKVKVKSFDGKTFYFNNLDEVPDDFEPASYKEWGRAVQDFTDKAASDRQAAADQAKADEQKATDRRVNDMQKNWDKDIEKLKLTKEKDINEVYDYMESQLKEGVVIDNFAQAYKALNYDKMIAKQEKQENDMKKLRGGMVQGGGTAPPEGGRRVFEAPPRGVGLDAVHNHVIQNL